MPKGIGSKRVSQFRAEYKAVEKILASCPTVKKDGKARVSTDAGIIFSSLRHGRKFPACLKTSL